MPRQARNRGTKGGHVTCLSRRGYAPNWSCEGEGGAAPRHVVEQCQNCAGGVL